MSQSAPKVVEHTPLACAAVRTTVPGTGAVRRSSSRKSWGWNWSSSLRAAGRHGWLCVRRWRNRRNLPPRPQAQLQPKVSCSPHCYACQIALQIAEPPARRPPPPVHDGAVPSDSAQATSQPDREQHGPPPRTETPQPSRGPRLSPLRGPAPGDVRPAGDRSLPCGPSSPGSVAIWTRLIGQIADARPAASPGRARMCQTVKQRVAAMVVRVALEQRHRGRVQRLAPPAAWAGGYGCPRCAITRRAAAREGRPRPVDPSRRFIPISPLSYATSTRHAGAGITHARVVALCGVRA